MSLTAKLIRMVNARSAKRFEAATREPGRVQREKLLSLVRKNADTEYGRRYKFSEIDSIEAYQKRVPVVSYDDIREDMDRVVDGARSVFTVEDPVMFAQTSGTTGEAKFIPVTPTCQGTDHRDVMRTWLYHAQTAHPRMLDGRIVTLVSPAVEGHTPAGVPYGSTSGSMYKNQSVVVRRKYSIPYRAFEIEDYQAKYYAIMRISLEHDVTLLCTANPSSILKMCEKADDHAGDIIRDIRDGTLSRDMDIEADIRAELEALLSPNPDRARFLEQAMNRRQGVLKPADYWPNLCLIGCWKGGTVGHYIARFDEWFNPDGTRPVPVRDWGFLSSEARGSVPLSDEGSAGVLTVATNFYEFVEVPEVQAQPDDPSSWRFLTVEDLKEGVEYYIFLTTSGGLYRYDINDVITVSGRYNATPQIVFLRKGRGMANITGEKISVNQVILATQQAAEETGVTPGHFKAEADTANSRYVLRVEFATRADDAAGRRFLEAFDRHLKAANLEYKAKRDSQRLEPPILHVMREGWYERDRRALVRSGRRAFQAKTEILSPMKLATAAIRPELERVIEFDAADRRA